MAIFVTLAAVVGLTFAFIEGHHEAATEAERDKPIKAPTRVETVAGENVVTLDAATQTNGAIALAPLPPISHRAEVVAYGSVLDIGELTDLQSAFTGAKAQLAKANAALTVARQEYARVKGLYAANQNASEKALQAAEGALRIEEANVQGAEAALNTAHAKVFQRWGRVISSWLTEGRVEFERLTLQKDLLIQITLAPDNARFIPASEAAVQTASGHLGTAKLISRAPRTNSQIQGRSFFYVIAANGELLPGMNITARLPMGDLAEGVAVPAAAVVWLDGKAWTYAQVQPNRFVRREVSTAQPMSDGWFQPNPFSRDQAFVIQNPQVLLSEEFRARITVGED